MKRIFITPGEPAGIGPDILITLAKQSWLAELVVIADPNLLLARAKQLHISLQLHECNLQNPPTAHAPGTLNIIPVLLPTPAKPGKLNSHHAAYVIETIKLAASLCTTSIFDCALVTGPVHKEIINQAGIAFTGHTEFFADVCHVALTVMLFVVDTLKVALATTHLPLAQVPAAITTERLQTTLMILHQALITQFHIPTPRIAVCGLNPHAGEGGYLGSEEQEIIIPLLKKLRAEQYLIEGPLPADTIFTPSQLQKADAILAMYHDQALPVVKYLGFDRAVNVTLGLPFLRTSVDHGTAIDLAGTGAADGGSMAAAIKLAIAAFC